MWDLIAGVFLQLHPVVQLVVILVLLFGYNTITITVPRIVRELKKEKKKISDAIAGNKLEQHENCPLYPDHMEHIKLEKSKTERIMEIRYLLTVYDQMSLVEVFGDKIRDMLTDKYIELLGKINGISERQQSDALEIYRLIVDSVIDEARGYLRRYIKRNHILEKTEIEFQNYIHSRSEELQKLIKKCIDRKYLKSQLIVDRKELYDENLKMFYESIQVMLADMFVEIRSISAKYAEKIEEIEKEKL